ncbi:MAG: hypothetical protein Q9175_006287 [Cornicularia normoerica]
MSARNLSKLYYCRDFFLGLVSLPLGRLFPTLEPPRVDLIGRVAIITGGNSGIGLQIALGLARQGATVYLACRNASKAEEAVSRILSEVPTSKGRVNSLLLDLSSLSSVRAFAKNWESLDLKIDLLFHNAGASQGQEITADGFPSLYAANFLGSFLLTYLLEFHLSVDARIILTTSAGQYASAFSNFSLGSIKGNLEPGFHVTTAVVKAGKPLLDSTIYNQTKGMQVAFAKLLQNHFDRKAAEGGIQNRRIAHAFSPGFTNTPILAKMAKVSFFEDPIFWLLKRTYTRVAVDASQGAATGVWLASTNDEAVVGPGMGGGYWDRMSRRLSNVDMMSREQVERFWVRWEADAGVEWR